jgi:hypothetical protein
MMTEQKKASIYHQNPAENPSFITTHLPVFISASLCVRSIYSLRLFWSRLQLENL